MDRGHSVTIVGLDILSAFDAVCHRDRCAVNWATIPRQFLYANRIISSCWSTEPTRCHQKKPKRSPMIHPVAHFVDANDDACMLKFTFCEMLLNSIKNGANLKRTFHFNTTE